jgi:uncharacterized protein
MNPLDIIAEYYSPDSNLYKIQVMHGRQVARKAMDSAKKVLHLSPDLDLIQEASMLHDIGIFKTRAASIGCRGSHPYVVHGYLGRLILEKKGLMPHALICERHVGAGLTADDIRAGQIPLPERDMVPVTIEEKIVCFADKFFSKDPESAGKEKSAEEIINGLSRYGQEKADRFRSWLELFEGGLH